MIYISWRSLKSFVPLCCICTITLTHKSITPKFRGPVRVLPPAFPLCAKAPSLTYVVGGTIIIERNHLSNWSFKFELACSCSRKIKLANQARIVTDGQKKMKLFVLKHVKWGRSGPLRDGLPPHPPTNFKSRSHRYICPSLDRILSRKGVKAPIIPSTPQF